MSALTVNTYIDIIWCHIAPNLWTSLVIWETVQERYNGSLWSPDVKSYLFYQIKTFLMILN